MSNERRMAEEALRESEQRWRSLTEALPQLVWSATPDGACDYFSTQWTEYTGVAENGLLGWRWMDVLHPDDRQSTRQFWTDSVAGDALMTWNTACAGTTERTAGSRHAGCRSGTTTATSSS